MMKNAKKILFPAVAAASMMESGHSAAVLTFFSPDGTLPLIDSAVTAAQNIQVPVGSTIYEGAAGTAVGTITINVVPSPTNNQGHCTFFLSDAFGASATAPAPAATVAAVGDCSKVSLYFVQKATAASTAYAMIRIKGIFSNVYYYTPIVPATKLTFCNDSAGSDTLTPITTNSMPPKQSANQPLNTIPGIVYLTNPDDKDQLATIIKAAAPKLSASDVASINSAMSPLFTDKRNG
ncbi:MAG: hypothetical protein CNLJKLNK_01071 [Holosporales bacterium]